MLSNVTRLNVLLKFNIVFLPVIAAGYAATGYAVWNRLSANAELEVMETAHLMLETTKAMRTYTTTQIAPLLDQEQTKVDQSVLNMKQVLDVQVPAVLQNAMLGFHVAKERQVLKAARQQIADIVQAQQKEAPEPRFFPQSIPFYAATEGFNYLREYYPDFSYKEAALNPTNPRDRTVDWEADVVNFFRNNPSKTEYHGHRDTPLGRSLYLSRPIRVDSESCLGCHGAAEKAPAEIVKIYGSGNGFGWKLGDVVGAQIVSLPADVALSRAAASMKTLLLWLAGIFAGLYAVINDIVFVLIIFRLVPGARDAAQETN
ncbi:MAG TPA: DUF3365 domain-containing protein [Methylocella sp.]|nr:DUF3365 domain-containing protein [Methylocella sp.]